MEFNIFAYWSGEDSSIRSFVDNWENCSKGVKIFKDREIRLIIDKHFREFVELYDSVTIPAAKSDIARLAVLYDQGGFYTDVHVGFSDANAVSKLMEFVKTQDAIVVNNALFRDKRPNNGIKVINSILFAKPGHKFFYDACLIALQNLRSQWINENEHGFVSYDIWRLTGPGVLNRLLYVDFDYNDTKKCFFTTDDVSSKWKGGITIMEEVDLPIRRNLHVNYRQPGMHWSERQVREYLFRRNPSK